MANTKYQSKRKYHIIYQTICLVNGKIYYGAHSTDNIDDGYLGSGDLIVRAIKKHGKQNFERFIECIFDNPSDMFLKEKEIVTPEFLKRSDVYNIVPGGYGGQNKGSLDLKHFHKPDTGERCAAHYLATDKMIAEGWTKGRGMSSTTGTLWIHRQSEKKMILPELLDDHIADGWSRGLPKSPTSGKKWIYNPTTNKYSLCEINELPLKLKEGWIKKKWAPRGPNKLIKSC
jgi:hypothetical protein